MHVVTGATGNVGSAIVADLAGRGRPVRAVVRSASAVLPDGAERVVADLAEPESLSAAFDGATSAFLMPGYPGVAEVARRCGVEHLVQLSGGSAGSADLSNAVTRYVREAEAEVRATGLPWTFLRPTAFMSNVLRWLPQLRAGDVVRAPFADVPLACVDPRDIAEVAAVAMVDDGHESMIYRPTGPEALLPEEQVAVLAAALGRRLSLEPLGNADARRDMLRTTPPEYVGAFFDFYVNGSLDETTVRPTVEDVTGRPARTFRAWVDDHIDAFAA